jgi:hypothetical protein
MGASALYFDILKDVSIVVMIVTSLRDLTKGHFLANPDLLFENMLLFALVTAILLVQVNRLIGFKLT